MDGGADARDAEPPGQPRLVVVNAVTDLGPSSDLSSPGGGTIRLCEAWTGTGALLKGVSHKDVMPGAAVAGVPVGRARPQLLGITTYKATEIAVTSLRRLLLVDDEERVLRAYARAWRSRHPTIEVVPASSSTAALRHIESDEPLDGALIDAYLGDPDKRDRRVSAACASSTTCGSAPRPRTSRS